MLSSVRMDFSTKFTASEFTKHFTNDQVNMYMSKLHRLGITDPYQAPGVLFTTFDAARDVPDLCYPDIYNYLINFPSSYTGDSLKSYKGLEGYKWNNSRFVHSPMLWNLPNKKAAIITARVCMIKLILSLPPDQTVATLGPALNI